jgi:hypothetical protein
LPKTGKRLLLRISTVRVLWRKFKIKKLKPLKKDAERRTTKRDSQREGHDGRASRVKTFQRPAMLKTAPLDCEKKQSLSEEARPVASGERTAKSGG